jgi:zinc transporter ZupT
MIVILAASLAALFTILGGSIPLSHRKLDQRTLTLLVAFSAGVLLSTGLNHMLRESFATAGRWAAITVSVGFLLLYLVEKVTMIHACREEECHVHEFGRFALLGIGFHSFLDGFAIAVSLSFEVELGILVIVAVLLHRLPTGISIATVMLLNHYPPRRSWLWLTVIGLLAVVGALLGLVVRLQPGAYLAAAVGLAAGTFLYISTSDLLPMAHQGNLDYRVPIAFTAGFVGMLGASFLPG